MLTNRINSKAVSISQKSHYSYVRFPAADVTYVASHYKELAIKMYKRCREVNYRRDVSHCFSEDVRTRNSEQQRIALRITVSVTVTVIIIKQCLVGQDVVPLQQFLRTDDTHAHLHTIMQFKVPLHPHNFYVLSGHFDTWYPLVLQHDYAPLYKQFKKILYFVG